MFDLQVLGFNNQQEYNKWMNKFNQQTAQIYQDAFRSYCSLCFSVDSEQIFIDWWNGKNVYDEEYISDYSEEDVRYAHNIILQACSDGFG